MRKETILILQND